MLVRVTLLAVLINSEGLCGSILMSTIVMYNIYRASAFSYVAVLKTVEQDALISAAARIKKYFFIVLNITLSC